MWTARFAVAGLVLAAMPALSAEHNIQVRDSFFSPSQLTIKPGDTVTWTNMGNLPHNVRADDGSFRCAQGCDGENGNGSVSSANWSFSRTFESPGEVAYFCELHGGPGGVGMSGNITVLEQAPQGMTPNFGHTGSWFNPATDGQGFLIEIVPEPSNQPTPVMVVYWFTFDEMEDVGKQGEEDQRWFQGTGDVGDPVSELDVISVTGGVFNQGSQVAIEEAGTMTVTFATCTEGTIGYELDLDGDGERESAGEIPIQRLTPDVECEALAGR